MKVFWIALVLLVALIVGLLLTGWRVEIRLSDMISALEANEIERVDALWQEHSTLFRLTLGASEIATIEDELAALFGAASSGDFMACESLRQRLLSALRRARCGVAPSCSDLF